MRQFKQLTGKDLWHTLFAHYDLYMRNSDKPIYSLLIDLSGQTDFETAAYVLYCLAQQENKMVELDEIQDAMLRAGTRLREDDESNFIQPYTLVLIEVAQAVDKQINETVDVKKKEPTGEL